MGNGNGNIKMKANWNLEPFPLTSIMHVFLDPSCYLCPQSIGWWRPLGNEACVLPIGHSFGMNNRISKPRAENVVGFFGIRYTASFVLHLSVYWKRCRPLNPWFTVVQNCEASFLPPVKRSIVISFCGVWGTDPNDQSFQHVQHSG